MFLQEHIPLSEHTTLRVGGLARFFVSAETLADVREALHFAKERSLPVHVLGGGSNTLFADEGWKGLVLAMALKGKEYEEGIAGDIRCIASAGESWDALVEETVSQGMWGLENLSFIPGTVGAAPVQNIACYGTEVAEHIEWVEALDTKTNTLHILSNEECMFGYRDSLFKHPEGKRYIITRVALQLKTHSTPILSYKDLALYFSGRETATLGEVREALRTIRGAKFPNLAEVGTAGSFFKNPIISRTHLSEMKKWLGDDILFYDIDEHHVKIPAGWLLERLGLRGVREGNVGTWKDQALAVVHYGGGTAGELLQFVQKIKDEVKKKVDIVLEEEVNIVGSKQFAVK